MNIWIISHYDTTPKYPGSTRHFDFAKQLVRRGHQVTIFASSIHYLLLKETIEYKGAAYLQQVMEGIRFVWIDTFRYERNNWKRFANMLSFSRNSLKAAKQMAKSGELEKPDIMFGSSIHLFAVYTAHRLAKRFRVPLLMEVRDLWPKTLIDFGFSKLHPLVIVLAFMEKFLYKRAVKIISLMPQAGDYIEGLGISREKIVYIPNGVDLEPMEAYKKETAGVVAEKNSFCVTYAGAIGVPNHMDVFIRAAEMMKEDYPQVTFLIVGDGKEKGRLQQMASDKNLSNVQFREPVAKNRLAEILVQSDVLFVALKGVGLYKYGISLNKLFDYLAAAKPIITSLNAANNPVEEAGAGICVPADEPEQIVEAVITLYNMTPQQREAMGQLGFELVKKDFSMPVLADKLEKLLFELVEK